MAASKDSSGGLVHECFYRCNSREHASNLTAVVTKASLSDEKIAAYLKWCCVKYAQALDANGRSLIHVAAASGRLRLLMFLLNHKEVNINCKDQESAYTPLHRSLFYGQIHCAVRLIQAGANIQQSDLEDLTPLDHVMKDRPSILSYNANQPCEVYVWGTNTNYTLGIQNHHSRTNPEPLNFFRKENISIKQAVMSKFHSLFLGSDGKVWSCGLGFNGRLGLGDESTVLVPKVVKIGTSSPESCVALSAGINHSLLLLENGSVWSFGFNEYHQLGHSPPPEKVLYPKAIKVLKGIDIIGISASKFHSVFWSKTQLFTCGLNGGQLGHLKTNENTIPIPKLITCLQLKATTIKHVASSDGATVVITCKGDIYLFCEYQCKKLTSKTNKLEAKKVCILGGQLDHKVHSSSLMEKGGDELKILILTEANTIYMWQESCPHLTRCLLSVRRYIDITDVVLNKVSLILTTKDGEAFQGEIRMKKKKTVSEDNKKVTSLKSSFQGFLNKDECNYIKLKRIPFIHRAVNVSTDLKGRNFAIVQVHPKTGLLQIPVVETSEIKQNMKTLLTTASEFDTLHDVIFEVCGIRFPAHRYIVSYQCEVLEQMINKAEVIDDIRFVKIENIQPQIFQRVLTYLYTGECDLLQVGVCPISFKPESLIIKNEALIPTEVINAEEISAYDYYKNHRSNRKKPNQKEETKSKDPIQLFRDCARTFELTSLSKNLESLRYANGYICKTSETKLNFKPPKFNRKNLQNLWDVDLKSESGVVIKAHKCILVARLEYFNCMINQGWLESTSKIPLNIPVPSSVLEILIHYLYTDEAPGLVDSDDPDLVCRTLILADQYFCTGLKEIAEASLASLINLKNAADVLQLAVTYNADQLKQCAMEFICLNLSALLESRSLEILDDALLTDLRDFYRNWLPCMRNRNIATTSSEPDDEFVEAIYNTEPVSLDKVEEEPPAPRPSVKVNKKKSQKEKKNSESERVRNTSIGSTTSEEELFGFCENTEKEEIWIKVTNHSTKQQKSAQSKSKPPPSPQDASPAKVLPDVPRTPSIPIQRTNSTNAMRYPPPINKERFADLDKDNILLSTSSDIEFPALSASAPERMTTITSPKSPSDSFKKFVKLSQKQRKRLAIQSISEDEETVKKPQESIKSVWGVPKIEPQSLVEIMKQENRTQYGYTASSPPWQGLSSPSLSAIMAAERQQRDLLIKMKSKPLEYTQMEDKAIDDLTLLYDIANVTDERITVRRADSSVLFSPPVWVSSHR